ncbi:hypothetical protein I8748_30580 [Nostoc sp. CENA67]|uniref:Uncharacterized protein n=1 Tax=Amazonocrinis nigriterrae CENA67 TaxID=2794033 RepID=A0A8J7HZV0_9NOST|nr:hypothetical protein [Amazonocrinis nigriterrae]MBH8566448.1 hypothetical protein [Amazonocrinis nigriterrae CENA67]
MTVKGELQSYLTLWERRRGRGEAGDRVVFGKIGRSLPQFTKSVMLQNN